MTDKKILIEELKKLPNNILVKEKEVIDANKEYQDNKEAIKNYEIAISNKVLEDSQKEEFKQKLSNTEKRKFEVNKRLNSSDDYKTYCNVLEDNYNRVQSLQLELDFLKRCFSSKNNILRAISD